MRAPSEAEWSEPIREGYVAAVDAADVNHGFFGLDTDLSTDLAPLTTIVTELGGGGEIASLLSQAVDYLQVIATAVSP